VKLVVATFNDDKLRELRELLDLPGVALVGLKDFPAAAPPIEDGATLADNARIKARAAHAHTGLPAIADDTGLEVDALGGRPGVHAARYAGPRATYADNVRRLLAELHGIPAERRTSRFRTVCVACFGPDDELVTEGVLDGRITGTPRGTAGFGYDPVFEIPELGRTLAELTPEEKNRVSHRARAARALAERIATRARDPV
jgi:XTP/dITP diphosphohydrolase